MKRQATGIDHIFAMADEIDALRIQEAVSTKLTARVVELEHQVATCPTCRRLAEALEACLPWCSNCCGKGTTVDWDRVAERTIRIPCVKCKAARAALEETRAFLEGAERRKNR